MTLYDTTLPDDKPAVGQAGAAGLKPWGETNVVGTRAPRIDAYERVSGTAIYTHDIFIPGMLHAAILRCPHPHANVRRVDLSKAKNMPLVLRRQGPDEQAV